MEKQELKALSCEETSRRLGEVNAVVEKLCFCKECIRDKQATHAGRAVLAISRALHGEVSE